MNEEDQCGEACKWWKGVDNELFDAILKNIPEFGFHVVGQDGVENETYDTME